MKKVLFIVLPVLLLGGGFVGLAVMGVVNVPGLSPKKAKAAVMYGESKDETKQVPKVEAEVAVNKPPKKEVPRPTVTETKSDSEKGTKKLAQLWNNLPSAKLVEVAKEFQDKDLAPVLVAMDPEKVAELLGAMDSKRSAKLCKELQRVASILPKTAG